MKRTVTANISGIVFYIEEDAFHELEAYLKRIREHLAEEEGIEEIMEDIEARLAELFKERTGKSKEVITDQDVAEVIGIMGRPEDLYDKGEAEAEEEEADQAYAGPKNGPDKRVYRNPDDKLLGGVCSGISAYMGWDPLWLRLGFVLATLLVGTGPLLYIILWVIIPEARTRNEKLHMRGESINLDNLKRRMKEEGEELKDRFGRFKEEMKSEDVKGHGRQVGQRLKELFQGILYWLGKSAEKLGGGLLLLFALSFTIILFVGYAGGGDHFTFVHTPETNYTFNAFLAEHIQDSLHRTLFKSSFFLAIGIPMFAFFFYGSKILFGFQRRLRSFGPLLFILWIIGLLICLYIAAYWSSSYWAG